MDTRDRLFVKPEYDRDLMMDSRVKPEYDRNLMVDTRVKPEYDGDLMVDTRVKPEYDGKRSLIKGLDVVRQCAALLERLKTHIKIPPLFYHSRAWLLARPEDLDSRDKPENDHNNLRPQCAPDATGCLSDVYKRGTRAQKTRTLETAESGVDKVVSSCEKNPNVHKTYMNFLRQRKTALDAPLHAVSSGRSMIEMLGVLAIIGVLSVGGIAGYTKAMEKIHVNKIVNMISDISATIKTAYISQKAYDDFDAGLIYDDAPQIQDMGLLPPEYIFELEGEKRIGLSSPLTIINPVGYGESGYSALSIGVLVPQNLCVPLLTYDWRNADMKGIVTHVDFSDQYAVGVGAILYPANLDENGNLNGYQNCDENQDEGYYCIEKGKQRFKPVSPAVAAKYCESSAADSFGTGQMYVGFDLLADVKIPPKL